MTHPTATDLERARADLVDAARAYEQAAKAHSAVVGTRDEVPAVTAMKLAADMMRAASDSAAAVMQSAANTVRRLSLERNHFAGNVVDLDRKIDDIKGWLEKATEAAK